jgi:hypothetical protein
MKTNTKNQIEKLGSQSAQCVETANKQADAPAKTEPNEQKQDTRLPIDTEARKANRMLPTPKVLSLLHQQAPAAYRLAEVVGRWVWVMFKEQPAAELRQTLSQIGFHWNRERQAWQHPCGKFSLGSSTNPHDKYSSYRPAAIRTNRKQQTTEATA